jgi:hypothetical protein
MHQISEEQKSLFVSHFYNVADSRLDDLETPCPWGCPWNHSSPVTLHGETIKEMAEKYWKKIEAEVTRILDEEENFAG